MSSTIDALTIINKASLLLGDISQTYWLPSELLGWLNDGQLEVAFVPESNNVILSKQLLPGIRQPAPTGSIRIIEFVRNMENDSYTSGSPIYQIDRKVLDRFYPAWTTDAPDASVIHAMYDAEDNSGIFYVWPPQPSPSSFIELIYSLTPTLIPNINVGTKITISDYFQNVLLNYILFRALSRSTENSDDYQRSQVYFKMFNDELKLKSIADHNANNDKIK